MITVIRHWWVLFRPSYWITNERVSKEWDRQLNELLDTHVFEFIPKHIDSWRKPILPNPTIIDSYNIKLGKETIWIKNHPYASFVTDFYQEHDRRAKRSTILKAEKKIKKELGINLYRNNNDRYYITECYNEINKN